MKAPATLKPKKLYRWITWSKNVERAVAALDIRQLQVLNGYLARSGSVSGIPSLIHGLIIHEASERLMMDKGKGKES